MAKKMNLVKTLVTNPKPLLPTAAVLAAQSLRPPPIKVPPPARRRLQIAVETPPQPEAPHSVKITRIV